MQEDQLCIHCSCIHGYATEMHALQEYDCTREGMSLIDDDLMEQVKAVINKEELGTDARKNIEDRLSPILNNKGKCVECGAGGDLPCFGMDFDGCNVHAGFMLDQDIVRVPAPDLPVAECPPLAQCPVLPVRATTPAQCCQGSSPVAFIASFERRLPSLLHCWVSDTVEG